LHGIAPEPYVNLNAMLEAESLDALAILSPSRTHETYLEASARAGLHALCEKPFVWGGDDLVARTRACVSAFRERGLLLVENCQWPYSMDAFRALHPDWSGPASRFSMHLAPASSGEEMLGDCLPHPLSLLQALAQAPDARVENIQYERVDSDASQLRVQFDYRAGAQTIAASIELETTQEAPRRAGYAIDGLEAERLVELPSYALQLSAGKRQVALPDPLTGLVRDFVAELAALDRGEKPSDPAPIEQRMALMAALVAAYRAQVDGGGV
jgi:predicted dehydrogenase